MLCFHQPVTFFNESATALCSLPVLPEFDGMTGCIRRWLWFGPDGPPKRMTDWQCNRRTAKKKVEIVLAGNYLRNRAISFFQPKLQQYEIWIQSNNGMHSILINLARPDTNELKRLFERGKIGVAVISDTLHK